MSSNVRMSADTQSQARQDFEEVIERMVEVLDEERAAMTSHNMDRLDSLQSGKAGLLAQLNQMDPAMLTPNDLLRLERCERKNLENGALIQVLHGQTVDALIVLSGRDDMPASGYDASGRRSGLAGSSGLSASA